MHKFLETLRALRHPTDGCPWDREQTHESLAKFVLEEAYEVVDAINRQNDVQLADELGDLLLQVGLHAVIGEERKVFNLATIADQQADKLIKRHPHVFGSHKKFKDSAEVLANWNKLKGDDSNTNKTSFNKRVKPIAPALSYSVKLGKAAAEFGFDWQSQDSEDGAQNKSKPAPEITKQITAKIHEELTELNTAVQQSANTAAISEEIGDVLFTVAQLARHLKIDPEVATANANSKFVTRVTAMEAAAGKPLESCSYQELEELWDRVKK